MVQNSSNTCKLLDKRVFKFFENFISENKETRIHGAHKLITFLSSDDDGVRKEKERAYALKRLVRGVGSDNNVSRVGYFTALVGYLHQFKNTEHCPTITDIFDLVKSELSDSEKDDADKQQIKLDIRVGKVSVCGAIINADLIQKASDLELEMVVKTLKKCAHKVLTSLAFVYLSELVQKIDSKKFSKIVWPVLEPMITVSKEQHSMDTIYFLLAALTTHKKSVNQQFFESNFGCPQLFHENNYEYLARLLTDIKHTLVINHPLYDFMIEHLVRKKVVVEFWNHGVDKILREDDNVCKFKDIVSLRILITILNKLENYSALPDLLSPGLMSMTINRIKNFSLMSEDVRDLYKETFETLNKCYANISDEQCKLQIFEKLLNPPSSILIEKYASNKSVQNLLSNMNDVDSVKKAASLLKQMILAQTDTDLLNSERVHAAQTLHKLLGHRALLSDKEWSIGIVKFFLNLGVFYSCDGVKILKSSKTRATAISTELVPTMKSLFFHCLEHRHAKLTKEKSFLLSIIDHVENILQAVGNKSLRTPLSEDHLQLWHRMYATVHSKDELNKRLGTVFHVLMMYMGLHMFSDPELASSSIVELENVMKRINAKKTIKSKNKMEINQHNLSNEPEWIEVVVDLFLNLMSQNSHLLRKVVGHVFPHLSGELTLTAFNQILSVINLKDKINPLSIADQENGDPVKQNSDPEEDDDTSGVESDGDMSENEQTQSESENDDETEFSDDEEDEKVTDKMRIAIHAALGNANPETDTESVDLDDMNEEQGRKLDEALAAAFKMFKQSKKTKPTKAEERVETTLTHFRMRVFDLIDIYLKNSPNMIICLELMLYVFEMLPVATKEVKHKQILDRYRQIFNNLTKIKQFNSDTMDVSPEQLSQILTDLMEKVAKGAYFPEKNQYLIKACQFIVICSQLLEQNVSEGKTSNIDKTFCKYLKEFIPDRNPPLTLNVFQSLFRMNWVGNWRLAKALAENGLKKDVRIVRRTQALQLLKELMKNRRFLAANFKTSLKSLGSIVKYLANYIDEQQHSSTVAQNEFSELVQLLLELHNFQRQHPEPQLLSWEQVGLLIQKLRRINLSSHNMNQYVRLCKQLHIKPIKNVQLKTDSQKTVKTNDEKSELTEEHETKVHTENGTVKRKKGPTSSKQKRLKNEERLKSASLGMESVSFV
ncbi:myb-binding protein 1A [Malaya genurostris]|uniref:myb-binding protein 1A n=1 Tax=Malaya genurostris TaxID=325434 RepID=UPI0026F38863|nr:myb-binding protein 1A [Malaya genurostris]